MLRKARSRRFRKPEPIGPILKSIIQNLGLEKGLLQQKVIFSWPEVVGKEIAQKTTPLRVRGSKLFVEVESSSWMNHLVYLKPEILSKLNINCKKQNVRLIQDIIFRAKRYEE